MNKKWFMALFVMMVSVFLFADGSAYAMKNIPDGGYQTLNGSGAMNVDADVKAMWVNKKIVPTAKRGNITFEEGGKDADFFPMVSGKYFAYDAYAGLTSDGAKRGLTKDGNYLTFDGWAIQYGYHHHGKDNQATYIGLRNAKDRTEKKIYKATMRGAKNINSELHYQHAGGAKICGANEYKKNDLVSCNMNYDYTQFRAYIPLADALGGNNADKEWELFIIKRVDDHIIYDELKLPFDTKAYDHDKGKVTINSGVDADKLIMLGNQTIKRATADPAKRLENTFTGAKRYFKPGFTYTKTGMSEEYGVQTQYRVKDNAPKGTLTILGGIRQDYEPTGTDRWAPSTFFEFGGKPAMLQYVKTKFDVTIRHIDVSGGREVLLQEDVVGGVSGKQTFKPYDRNKFKDGTGNVLVPISKDRTINNVNDDLTIVFEYKASIPDPSRIVEMGGGKNTHGHAEGKALWELNKTGKSTDIPDSYEALYEWKSVVGGVEITKYLGTQTSIVIPSRLDGKDVVSLGTSSFLNKNLESVIIPHTVKKIGTNALFGNKLTEIIIPGSVAEIGANAFLSNELSHVVIPGNVKRIGENAFGINKITSLEIQDGVEVIGSTAFANNKITSVSLPKTVVSVGNTVFTDNDIVSVYVYNTMTTFGTDVFSANQSNSKNVIIHGFDPSSAKVYANNNNHTFKAFESDVQDFLWREVSDGIEIIKYIGFDDVVGIPNMFDGKVVVSIGEFAFAKKDLTGVAIPSTVKRIGLGAFEKNNLTSVSLSNNLVELGGFAFYENKLTSITIPKNIKQLADSVFQDNKLTSVDVSHVSMIGKNTFSENKISNLVLSDVIGLIDEGAFSYNELTEIEFPLFTDEIGKDAFRGNKIHSVTIPHKETIVGEGAFSFNQTDSFDLTIYGYAPSTAKEYAEGYYHTFVDLDGDGDFEFVRSNANGTYYNKDGLRGFFRYIGDDKEVTIPDKIKGVEITSYYMMFSNTDVESVVSTNKRVTNMSYMFTGSKATNLNLTNFDTSNVTNMNGMFEYSEAVSFDLSGFDTRKVSEMDYMFNDSYATTGYARTQEDADKLNASGFKPAQLVFVVKGSVDTCNTYVMAKDSDFGRDTSQGIYRYIGKEECVEIPASIEGNVVRTSGLMFNTVTGKKVKGVRFSNKTITNTGSMFMDSTVDVIDLSGFDMSNVTNTSNMFRNAKAKTGYARTQADANKLNASSGKPAQLVFVVKGNGGNGGNGGNTGASGVTSNGLEWKKNDDTTIMITGYKGSSLDVVIPDKINGENVTVIGEYAFADKGLKSVTLPNRLREIGKHSFSRNVLTTIDIPPYVLKIGWSAFLGDTTIPNSSNALSGGIVIRGMHTLFEDNALGGTSACGKCPNGMPMPKKVYGYIGSTTETHVNSVPAFGNQYHTFLDINSYSFNTGRAFEEMIKEPTPDSLVSSIQMFNALLAPSPAAAPANVGNSEDKPSLVYAENNFLITGIHYDFKNVKYTLDLGTNKNVKDKPLALLVNPDTVKDKDMVYNLEYEYTNHYQMTYSCTEKLSNDCFAWAVSKYAPVYTGAYGKKFSLSETEGTFTHSHTSRVGRINNQNVKVYTSPTSATGTNAGSAKIGVTYYIKEKATKGNDTFYLLSTNASRTSGVIGWVNELDLSTHSHYSMDSKAKDVVLSGQGVSYNMVWGNSKQVVNASLTAHKGKVLKVNLTETIGDNIWYRGTISGVSGNVWVHKNHVYTNEFPRIVPTAETVITNGTKPTNLKLMMNHDYGKEIEVSANNTADFEFDLLVGREHRFEAKKHERIAFDESFKVSPENTSQYTQTARKISEKVTYDSDLGNRFYVIEGDKYYLPDDIDENLRAKYANNTGYTGGYAIPVRVADLSTNEATFLLKDNFFVTGRAGMVFSLPHDVVSSVVINDTGKSRFEALTGNKYNDYVLGDAFDGSNYYPNIDLRAEQSPGVKYSDDVVLGMMGLNDITLHLKKDFSFDRYLIGHIMDDPVLVSQRGSVLYDVEYQKEVIVTPEQITAIKELANEREGLLYHFWKTDSRDVYEKLMEIVPSF